MSYNNKKCYAISIYGSDLPGLKIFNLENGDLYWLLPPPPVCLLPPPLNFGNSHPMTATVLL